MDNLNGLEKTISELLLATAINIDDIILVLKKLSSCIPLIFVADEIQEFQKGIIVGEHDHSEETSLHYFTRILKDLLRSNILLLLSGTRYHILSQIGEKIGSPIRGKVFPVIITKFEPADIIAYRRELERIIAPIIKPFPVERVALISQHYQRFLFAFSGGHPRTIFTITSMFVENLVVFYTDTRYESYPAFLEYFLPRTKKAIPQLLLGSDHAAVIKMLAGNVKFGVVKSWIVDHGYDGQFLGLGPTVDGMAIDDDEITDILYQLMNIGIILQNGGQNYHLTSYFHLLAFLKQFDTPREAFLRQILDNTYFSWLCGGHAGLGYTFETIFASVLLSVVPAKNEKAMVMPFDPARLRSIVLVQGQPRWHDLTIEPDVLYRMPNAKAIDMLVLQDDDLFAIQLSTALSPAASKISNLIDEMNILAKSIKSTTKKLRIRGWMVSLFPIEVSFTDRPDVVVTSGDELIPVIGKDLYAKLREVKNILSKMETLTFISK